MSGINLVKPATDRPLSQDPIELQPELLRIHEAAKMLNISERQAYYMAKRREIPVVHLGKSVRVPLRALRGYIDSLNEQATEGQRPQSWG